MMGLYIYFIFVTRPLSSEHGLNYLKNGDFIVDEEATFEVVGRGKTNKQIKAVDNAYVVSADIEVGSMNKIPLWLFGFLS